MNIPFWKMHGASNDFILIDDREETFPLLDGDWLAAIASRRTGVGSEGIILIQNSSNTDFRMRFFNPDGSEVEMCGNGARCVARLAYELGVAPAKMTFDTVAGKLGAEILDPDTVRLTMTPPFDWKMDLDLGPDLQVTAHQVNTGVPHVVVPVDQLGEVHIQELGAAIRYHRLFAPAGTNANFIQVNETGALQVRTYERGVEAETLACGTGMVACGLIANKLGLTGQPVTVIPASGDKLLVGFRMTDEGAEHVTLTGPAVHVYQGELIYRD